jgi:hypothetical protein
LVTLDAAGVATIENKNITATASVALTAQDGGATPTGSMFLQGRNVGASFTIASTAGDGDAGVVVYWALCWS